MSYYFHKYYLKTLHIDKYLKLDSYHVYNLKLFQENKLICLTNKNFFIYNFLNDKRLYEADNSFSGEFFQKIELIDYDKFILYNEHDNNLLLLKYIENENNCVNLISMKIQPIYHSKNILMNIIYNNKKLIISNNNIYIYDIINYKYIQLQSRLVSNSSKANCFLLNKEILGFFGFDKKIEFWNISHYSRWIYTTDELPLNSNLSEFTRIINLKNNDHILIDSNSLYLTRIYLFSYVNRTIINEFYMNINGFCLSKNNTLFVLKEKHICLFDVKKGKLFKVNRLNIKFRKNLLIHEDSGTFIADIKKEILFLKTSAFKTVFMDALYFFGFMLYFFLLLLYKFRKRKKDEKPDIIKLLFGFVFLFFNFKYYVNIQEIIEIDIIQKKKIVPIAIIIFFNVVFLILFR